MSPRAPAMAPPDRREALIAATVPLLRLHGRDVTTRQIAEAAGVAEGTIFRVVASKDELVDAAIARAFEPGDVAARIEAIDADLDLQDRLVAMVAILQERLHGTFALIAKVGLVRPPEHVHDGEAAVAWRARLVELVRGVIGDDAEALEGGADVVDHVVHVLRLLTFAGSHPHISDGRLLSPEQVVATVLHGHLRRSGQPTGQPTGEPTDEPTDEPTAERSTLC